MIVYISMIMKVTVTFKQCAGNIILIAALHDLLIQLPIQFPVPAIIDLEHTTKSNLKAISIAFHRGCDSRNITGKAWKRAPYGTM